MNSYLIQLFKFPKIYQSASVPSAIDTLSFSLSRSLFPLSLSLGYFYLLYKPKKIIACDTNSDLFVGRSSHHPPPFRPPAGNAATAQMHSPLSMPSQNLLSPPPLPARTKFSLNLQSCQRVKRKENHVTYFN